MYRLLLTLSVYCGLTAFVRAQELPKIPSSTTPNRKSLYFTWSYNRDWYSRSTIRFKNTTTDNYDFKIIDAVAHDRPDLTDFWKFQSLTIPQYNAHLGYFFGDKHDLGIELSWDHLKYVVDDNRVFHVQGNVRGQYIDKDTLVTPSFVHLQHTNGNNYLMINLVKRQKLAIGKHLGLSTIYKVGAGGLISYTISTVLGDFDKGHFHPQGFVAGANVGLRLDIFRNFFLQTDFQGAYALYTGSELGHDHVGRATHHFYSAQWLYGFGFNVPLGKL